MIRRIFWLQRLEAAWQRKSVIWLMGVRRAGKTVLCRSLEEVEYFDCELPRVRRQLEDPQSFFDEMLNRRLVLDEIHRLPQPSELLKIAADHYPDIRVVATGSSTLGASARFRDTLAGRKEELWLTPINSFDLDDFGARGLDRRMSHGGLSSFFLAEELPEREYQEWLEAFWAKDILELFRLERRHSFLRFLELLLAQSGGIFEATNFARPCEVSRTTISNYLAILEATFVVHVLRPFSTSSASEIVSAPKVYGFDTGFVCYARGWDRLRQEDRGLLWEHLVLNELHSHVPPRAIHYWRSKHGNEIDFVLTRRGKPPFAIECKHSANDFEPRHLKVFRNRYPEGANLVAAADVDRPFNKRYGELTVRFIGLGDVAQEVVARS